MREHLHSSRSSIPLSFVIPPNQNHITMWPHLVPYLPIFMRNDNENPYSHIKELEEIWSTFQEANIYLEILYMKLFLLTMKDKAKFLLNSLRPYRIRGCYNQCVDPLFFHVGIFHLALPSYIIRCFSVQLWSSTKLFLSPY